MANQKLVECKVVMSEIEWEAMVDTLRGEGFLGEGGTDEEALDAMLRYGLPWEETESKRITVVRL